VRSHAGDYKFFMRDSKVRFCGPGRTRATAEPEYSILPDKVPTNYRLGAALKHISFDRDFCVGTNFSGKRRTT
jgi:hypothetical protein